MKYLFCIFFLWAGLISKTQGNNLSSIGTEGLEVGDNMPFDIELSLFNFKKSSTSRVNFSEYKDKLILLDIWGISCTSCIQSFTHLEELQKQYADKIQIFLVNPTDSLPAIKKLLKRREKAMNASLEIPIIYSDSLIGRKLFKHESIPHVIWINRQGKVYSITDGINVSVENIEKILNGLDPKMEQKDDYAVDRIIYDPNKPYFVDGNIGNAKQINWFSVLSGRVPAIPYSIGIVIGSFNGSPVCRVVANNSTVIEMCRLAYTDMGYYDTTIPPQILMPLNRTVLSVKDTTTLVRIINGIEHRENEHVYQLLAPTGTTYTELLNKMKNDLDAYFHLRGYLEKKTLKCLVLSADDTALIQHREGDPVCRIDDYSIRVNKVTMNKFLFQINWTLKDYANSPNPIVDETGFKGNIGRIEIDGNIMDYHFLNKALEKYKMHLRLEDREVRVLVIRNTDFPNN